MSSGCQTLEIHCPKICEICATSLIWLLSWKYGSLAAFTSFAVFMLFSQGCGMSSVWCILSWKKVGFNHPSVNQHDKVERFLTKWSPVAVLNQGRCICSRISGPQEGNVRRKLSIEEEKRCLGFRSGGHEAEICQNQQNSLLPEGLESH